MPNVVRSGLQAGNVYASPWRGEVEHTAQIRVDITALTDREIDDFGYLKPGVPFLVTGALVSTNAQSIFGVTIEAINVLNRTPYTTITKAASIAAAGNQDIVVGTIGQVNRHVIEDILGSALTANELLAFAAVGCTVKLLA